MSALAARAVDAPTDARVREALRAGEARLAEAGCETPRLDAELLLADALGAEREWLITGARERLGREALERFDALVDRRCAREPVAYILGRKGFRRLELRVDRRVLVPRPETELLAEAAIELAPGGARVHDVGTGSGAVALALKDERPDLVVSASDASPGAVEVAGENAARLGLEVALSVDRGLPAGRVDLVVANLPYVTTGELAGLMSEVRDHEPREALDGGSDGLREIRALVEEAPSGTQLALEHAPGQAAAVRAMLAPGARTWRDLAGRERVTAGRTA